MKNPLAKLSPRGRRIYYTIIVLFVFGIGLFNCLSIMYFNATGNDQCAWRPMKDSKLLLITDIVKEGVTDKAGIKENDTLVAVNGKNVENFAPQQIINNVPSGEYATYLVGRATGRIETKVQILKVFNVVYLANFLLGLGFLIVGYIVVLTRPQGLVQRKFANYSIAAMMCFSLVIPDIPPGSHWLRASLLSGVFIIGRIIAPPIFIRFFYFFPVLRKQNSSKWRLWIMYIVSALFLVWLFKSTGTNNFMTYIPFTFPYFCYVTGLLVFAHSYFKFVDKDKRKQLRPILISVVIGISAFVYIIILGTTNTFLIFLNPIMFVPGILIINVPIAFGYSIFRYRLMDIDLIVKRSLIYGIVTTSLAILYLLIVTGIGNGIAYFFGTEDYKLINELA